MSSKKKSDSKSPAEQSQANVPRTAVGKSRRDDAPPTNEGENAAEVSQGPLCEKCGQVHRRCNGHTRHGPNAGKPCGANPRTGQNLCVKHGGNHPAHKKAAKERLLELVDPALAALFAILTDPKSDDAVKVRAAISVLDRTGFRPGVVVEIDPSDKWAGLLDSASSLTDNRSLGGGGEGQRAAMESAAQQFALDASNEAWAAYQAEDDEPYVGASRIRPDENTIRGQVVHDPDPVTERYGEPMQTREEMLLERLDDEPEHGTRVRRGRRYP